ncbi:hypothetical protein GQ55_8G185500 [Panicum hallii var. hallii]|uniref:Uncharacterized protein n=1 Tax=Panicum hallii var. hallii TaxID=1504633 RepID=A0A2T7CP26_9POAL|nr:hypothetical protein GQ55_8G185500 [Panicum hallii var. hallii]
MMSTTTTTRFGKPTPRLVEGCSHHLHRRQLTSSSTPEKMVVSVSPACPWHLRRPWRPCRPCRGCRPWPPYRPWCRCRPWRPCRLWRTGRGWSRELSEG